MVIYNTPLLMWTIVTVMAAISVALVAAQCNTGLPNVTLPDNGNVCDLLADPDPIETTCVATVGAGLNAALDACAGDTFIEIRLEPGFFEAGPFVFPDVKGIAILGAGTSTMVGGSHVVVGNDTALEFVDVVFSGEGSDDKLFDPPLRSNNFTLVRSLVTGFHGRQVIVQEGCEDDVEFQVLRSYFFDNWGASLFASGLYRYNVQSNVFDRCGGNEFGATFLKTHWANDGVHIFFNNSQWVLFDEQPPLCISYFDGGEHVRCRDGVFECEDLTAAQLDPDCPRDINKTFVDPATNQTVSELLFQPFCRRYRPCRCETVIFRDVANLSVANFDLNVGDIIYPYLTLECQAGATLFAGGSVGSVAPLEFADPSFEQEDNVVWATSGNLIRPNSETRPKSRTGNSRIICNGGEDQWFEQTLNFTAAGSYLISFWGARRDGQRDNYGDAALELYIDGALTDVIQDPTFYDTLVGDLTYYEFLFTTINIVVPGEKVVRFRCNFINTGGGLEFGIDDVGSRVSGIEVVNFPPGQGLGPPPFSDPEDFIAQPLTIDAFIEPLPCPPCPDPPDRPPNLPCNYVIQENFTCFRTVYQGNLLCVEPAQFNVGVGAAFADFSFENATFWWNETEGSPVVVPDSTPGTQPALFGSNIVYAPSGSRVALEQNVVIPDTAVYSFRVYVMRYKVSLFYVGAFIQLTVDGLPVATISSTDIVAATPAIDTWGVLYVTNVPLFTGVASIGLVVDTQFGGLQLDGFQFLGATASASATPTPSLTPSPSMVPSNMTGTNGTMGNTTEPVVPDDLLECIEEIVYVGGMPFIDGCIVPGDLPVLFDGSSVTANDCLTLFGCALPEMFSFVQNDTEIVCMSLSMGMMTCDCSSDKLIGEFLNRTLTPGVCAYDFDKIPRTASAFFIRENRAQQLDFGGCSRRIEYDTVVESSVAFADYFDEKAVGREILKQSNQLWGLIPDGGGGVRPGPRFLMDGLTVYEEICEDNCPMANPTCPNTNIDFCIVDSAGADFVDAMGPFEVYATVQEALDKCSVPGKFIDVRESENFYEEELSIPGGIFHLFSSTNATIAGIHRFRSGTDVFFSRGIRWLHNGRNGEPLFDLDDAGDLRNLTLYNNDFPGNGVKDAGVLRNRGREIALIDFRYNMVRDYQTTGLRFDARDVVIAHNTFEDDSGRLVQVRYAGLVRSQHNVQIDSRGAPNIKKPAMLEYRFRGDRDDAPCNAAPGLCRISRNEQLLRDQDPEDAEDFKETGILLRGGAFFLEDIRDNVVIKARTGMRLRNTEVFISPELVTLLGTNEILELIQFLNSLVRPSRTRRVNDGDDFMVDTFFEGSRVPRLRCNFPDCVPVDRQPQRCIANLNFESYYSDQFGWETYTNASQASFFCVLDTVNVTVFGGARIIPERLAIRRPFSNDLQKPLLDEPTNEEILVGDRPVPDRFTLQGVQVDEADVPLYASLLDANNTYGFGDGEEIFVQTDLTCLCPGRDAFNNNPIQVLTRNCTDLIGPAQDPDLCADALAANPNATACYVFPDDAAVCTNTGGISIVGNAVLPIVECTLPLHLTFLVNALNLTLINGTLVNVTIQVPQNQTYLVNQTVVGNPQQCVLELDDIFRLEFREGTLNLCNEPAYYSVGNDFRSLNMTWRDLAFYLHYGREFEDDELDVPQLGSVVPIVDVRFERVRFDGRGVAAPTRLEALKVEVGLDVPDQLGRKQRNRRPPVFSTFDMENCSFANYLFFETILNNTAGSALEQDEVVQFPYIIAMDVEFVNTLVDDPTTYRVRWTNFTDIDRTAIRVRFANFTDAEGCLGQRTGGRSLDTPAAYFFEANARSVNAVVRLVSNNWTQTRPVPYPFLGDLTVPAYQALVWVTGLRDQAIYDCTQLGNATIDECLASVFPSCCPALVILDNFWCGLPYGLRLVGERDVLVEYILRSLPTGVVPVFDDDLSALRELAIINGVSIDGTVCDIVLGPPDQDWREEHLCCEESCAPRAPSTCRINSDDPRVSDPLHPWRGIYYFVDPNQCLEVCQARSRQCDLERPSNDATYEYRLDATVTEPAVLEYRATWSGPINITVLATLPMGGLVSPPAVTIPIEWDDFSLPPVNVVIVPGDPPFMSTSVEVSGRLQMPDGIPELVPTETPGGWLMTIEIVYTFCAPGNTLAPVAEFPVSFDYLSPPINVNTPSFDYAAVLVTSWEWNATAKLVTATGATLNGVGLPDLECNGHSPQGADITVQNVKFLHGDPCVDATLDPLTCPCTVSGLATWQQQDATPAPNLVLRDNMWDGRGYAAIAIDGEFWNRTEVRGDNTFVDYRAANPGYVIRLRPSTTQDCCAQPCENEFVVRNALFLGQDGVSMTGSLVSVGPAEVTRVRRNTAVDAGGQDTVHPEAALFCVMNCPGLPMRGSLSENTAERTTGAVVQTRIPPNDCYWAVAKADSLEQSGGYIMERNVQVLDGPTSGAPICLRAVDWPKSSPSNDCRRAARNLGAQNPECDGSLVNVFLAGCEKDVCLARQLGCPGVDPACDAATVPPCENDDDCLFCETLQCGRPAFEPPLWLIILAAVILALLAYCLLYCCGCCVFMCLSACPRRIVTRERRRTSRPITTLDERQVVMQLSEANARAAY